MKRCLTMTTINNFRNSKCLFYFSLLVLGPVLFLSTTGVFAQGINEQVTVVGSYEPSIPDVSKINISPAPSESEVKLPVISYNISPVQQEVALSPEEIPAVKLVGEPQKTLLRNYIRAGFGNYTTPYAEFWANSLRSKSHSLGVHLKHLSSSGEIKDFPISSNSVNLAELQGRKFLDEHTLSAGVSFKRNVVHHYGFDPGDFELMMKDDQLKQHFNRFGASAGIQSNYSGNDRLNHKALLAFKNTSDRFNTRESSVSLLASADKRFEVLDFTDEQQIGLDARLEFTGYKDSTLSQASTIVSLKPYIGTTFNEYTIRAGIDLSFQGDSVSKAYMFPFAEARLSIVDEALGVYAGITGGLERKGFDRLAAENPFIQSVLPLRYTREKFIFYGGANARAGKRFNFYASFRAGMVDNAVFFVNDFSVEPYNRFTLVYDDGSMVAGRLEAEFVSVEKIRIKAFAAFEKWDLKHEEKAWHKPGTTLGAEAAYNLGDKILARATVTAAGKQYARLSGGETNSRHYETVKGYTDLSFAFEYRYTRQLSAFLNLNNVLGSRQYHWYNYPGYRFNLLGGIAYSF